jgi:hypothetical protein
MPDHYAYTAAVIGFLKAVKAAHPAARLDLQDQSCASRDFTVALSWNHRGVIHVTASPGGCYRVPDPAGLRDVLPRVLAALPTSRGTA